MATTRTRNRRVGIIAEDTVDVESARTLIHRITGNRLIGVKRFVGRGCGRIRRKCRDWSGLLKLRGCSVMIVIHDLDTNILCDLRKEIEDALDPCPIDRHLICIPVQEFEAWLLSDPAAIKSAMNLQSTPKVKEPPETINSPKEYLGNIIRITSKGEKVYINTTHNDKIAAVLSIDRALSQCPSFVPFHDFVRANLSS